MGLDFFSSYSHHLPLFMMRSRLSKMAALDYTYTQNILDAVRDSHIDVLGVCGALSQNHINLQFIANRYLQRFFKFVQRCSLGGIVGKIVKKADKQLPSCR
jgi:hypothetical protein